MKDIKKTRWILRVVGWILMICDICAFFIGGKGALFTWSAVLLITYAIYVIWYPYIYIISPADEIHLRQYHVRGTQHQERLLPGMRLRR